MTHEKQIESLHVLLAEDDKDDRFFFAKALNAIPIPTRLTTVHDGEQLITYLLEHTEQLPDVLFLDINMPRKNGYECISEIRKNNKWKDLYVVMFSTFYSRSVDYERDMLKKLNGIGVNDLIRKPNDFTLLQQIIHNVLIQAGKIRPQKDLKDSITLPDDPGLIKPSFQ